MRFESMFIEKFQNMNYDYNNLMKKNMVNFTPKIKFNQETIWKKTGSTMHHLNTGRQKTPFFELSSNAANHTIEQVNFFFSCCFFPKKKEIC